MPKTIRVDNGKPLGDPQRKLIPLLSLWLESKGVQVIFNRPRRPTDNSKVERMQRTTKNWAEVANCKNIEELKRRLKKVSVIQRELFKVNRLNKRTRKQAFPELYTNPIKYDASFFDIQNAYLRLSKWTFSRKVNKVGIFRLYAESYYLGRKFAKQYVSIQLDLDALVWNVKNSKLELIKTFSFKSLNEENLKNLTACQRT